MPGLIRVWPEGRGRTDRQASTTSADKRRAFCMCRCVLGLRSVNFSRESKVLGPRAPNTLDKPSTNSISIAIWVGWIEIV